MDELATNLSGQLCLVTGGAGFIGSHLTDSLLKVGAHVRVLDNFSTGFRHNLEHLQSNSDVEVVDGDAADSAVVQKAMKDVRYVFHHAAMASVPRSMREPELCHAWCTTSTVELLKASAQNSVNRFVLASTSAAYGDSPFVSKRESGPDVTTLALRSSKTCRRVVRSSFPTWL